MLRLRSSMAHLSAFSCPGQPHLALGARPPPGVFLLVPQATAGEASASSSRRGVASAFASAGLAGGALSTRRKRRLVQRYFSRNLFSRSALSVLTAIVTRATAQTIDVPTVGSSQLKALKQHLVFFGGKGGVGKTSSSAAYAAGMAAKGKKVLIISTDPAHSLGDALAEELSGTPRQVAENLWACEVDPSAALAELRKGLQALDAKSLLDGLGLPGGTTAALGLNELSELFESPPPGVDEIAAIAKAASDTAGYDVVVFDTAPTGHTLRLLEVPAFLSGFLDRALSIRKSVGGVLGMLGLGAVAANNQDKFDEAESKVRAVRDRVVWLGQALKTPPETAGSNATAEFVAVTRPTALDCAEVERLVSELRTQGICCKRMIINQLLEPSASVAYWNTRCEGQGKVLTELRSICDAKKLPLIEVTDRPESLVGVPALGYLASLAYNGPDGPKPLPSGDVTFFGGKGGVGKTSMSSALAVRAATEGQRVLIISTDPAHSLGDALGVKLSAKASPVDGFAGAGELWAMEVDTAAAMKRFQATVREALQRGEQDGGIVGQVLQQLPMDDFVNLFDTLPPGSDEIVALVEVLDEVKKEKFDRIVIDTAPTGHALRLLSFPDFLERLADRVARLRDRFGWLTGGGGGKDELRSFQFRMIELQDLFTDSTRTSFAVVTIPTILALEESKRLLKQLEEQDIRVGIVIVNRILDPERVQDGTQRLLETQRVAMEGLEALAKKEKMDVKRVPYLDREVRGIYGLQYLSNYLEI